MAQFPVLLQDILTILNQLAPFSLAESWDNVGLMVGTPNQKIHRILLGLDPTFELIQEAHSHDANLVITHHPLIFNPLKIIRTDVPVGHCIETAIRDNIAIVACHTNLDAVQNGVSHILAKYIGIQDFVPLSQISLGNPQLGFGCIGALAAPLSAEDFLANLCSVLGLPVLKICGAIPPTIQDIAVCGGSGSDFAEVAQSAGAQVYITGEVKHSVARWAEESGLCIIDAGHFATENLVVESLATSMREIFREGNIDLPVITSSLQKDPFFYYIKS